MRKTGWILSLVVGGLGLVGFASGQGGGGAPGGGRGGFGGGAGGGFRLTPLQLVNDPAVKKELEITEEQTQAIPDAINKAIGGVLSAKQLERLKQIEFQQRGNNALLDVKIQDALKLSDSQRDNIKSIIDDSRKDLREASQGAAGGGGAGFKGVREKIEKVNAETQERIQGVLTLDQKNALKKMGGEPFKLERGFGFGGAGGGFGPGAGGPGGTKRGEFKKKTIEQ